MIDLSFLTGEEQEVILAVLRRDAELKKAEEARVNKIKKSVNDKNQLKYMTGEWFYETKSQRHQDRIHGSDIIMASMRQKPDHLGQKPVTILELSQKLPERPSFVNSCDKDVHVPAELSGLLEEPQVLLSSKRDPRQIPNEMTGESSRPALQSPTKQRKNPFNSEPGARLTSGTAAERSQTAAQRGEKLPTSDSCGWHVTDANQRHPDNRPDASVQMPVPKERTVTQRPQDSLSEVDRPAGRQISSPPPRGILKNNSASVPDPHSSPSVPQSPVRFCFPADTGPESERDALIWTDRKQVRFSAHDDNVERQAEKGLGEHSLLDGDRSVPVGGSDLVPTSNTAADTPKPLPNHVALDDCGLGCEGRANLQSVDARHLRAPDECELHSTERLSPQVSSPILAEQGLDKLGDAETMAEEDGHSQKKARDWFTWGLGHSDKPQPNVPKQSSDKLQIPVEAASDTKSSSDASLNNPSHAVSPKPRKRLLGIFSRGENKEKTSESQIPDKEEVTLKQKQVVNTMNLCDSPSSESAHGDDDDEIKTSYRKQDAKSPRTSDFKTLNLTALQNTSFKETSQAEMELDGSQNVQFEHVTGVQNSHHLLQTEFSEHCKMDNIATQSNEMLSPRVGSCLLLDLPKKDGTYRASPVLICEETDNLDSMIIQQPEKVTPPLSVSPSSNTSKHHMDNPVPISSQSSSRDSRSTKINDLKSFWEKESPGPRTIVGSVKEAKSNPVYSSFDQSSINLDQKTVTSRSDVRTSECRTGKVGEGVESPSLYKKTSTSVAPTTKHVNEKGFVSQSSGKAQLKTYHDAEDVETQGQQHQPKMPVSVSAEPQQRPLSPNASPSRFQTSWSKDSSDDELRRSPSKTCHPRALPRESSSSKGSKLDGSPLKTFPINIGQPAKDREGHVERPIPAARQKKSPSHEAKQSGTTTTKLARAFVPQNYHHYLGSPEKAHLPPFHQENPVEKSCMDISSVASSTDAELNPLEESVSPTLSMSANEESHSNKSSRFVKNAGKDSNQDNTPRICSRSWASSGSYLDDSSPVKLALKRLSTKPVSSSKSLDNLSSETKERVGTAQSGHLNQSVDHDPEQMKKMSLSVPVFQQEERDSDCASEDNLNMSWRRNTGSSMSNISISSGMASMSSVSGSVMSISTVDFGDVEVQGTIQFAMNYVQKLGEFHIFVVQCQDLAVAEPKKHRSDPYVKCYLLPDKTKLGKRKTSVKKKSLNPTYNEILRFKIAMDVLKNQKLNISVWHNDNFGRNSFLGEVELDLSEWNFSNTQINDYALQARVSAQVLTPAVSHSELVDKRGLMRVALRFLPQTSHSVRSSAVETGEVQIWVKDCKNLPPARGVIIDPFVKCTVLPDASRKGRQKTRVVKRTANPMFNHTMVYDGFRSEDLKEACIELTVWDHDRLHNHYIGGLRLGLGTGKSYGAEVGWMDSTTEEANLWERMMQSHSEWVEDILPLRMFLMAKSMSK